MHHHHAAKKGQMVLARGALVHSTKFERHGLKSFVRAVQKYGITPTVDGPYTRVKRVEQRGNHAIHSKYGQKVGGRAHLTSMGLAKKDATSGQTGEVPAQDVEQNSEYLATVSIGTPAQNLNLDFDTGSADLWVFSTSLPSADQKNHSIFDPSKSSTWKVSSGSTWKISYGDSSSASGTVGTDNLTVGGLVVENQAIEIADTISSEFVSGQGDGLLGLAWGSINTVQPTPVATPVENMITQQDIQKSSELFTAYLGDTNENSFYTFGYIDTDATAGATPEYAAVDNSQGFWMFDSASASVAGKTITLSGNKAIADTGTTLAMVSDELCKAAYGAISGAKLDNTQQGYVIPTSVAITDYPAIRVAVGDNLFTINPEGLQFQDLGNGYYYGGLQSRGDLGFDILGDVFLRSVYAVFDQGNTRFGCVQRAAGTSSNTTDAASTQSGPTSKY